MIFITDIPAPYRIEMYNSLDEIENNLEVWYFQHESKARHWKLDKSKLKHRYRFANGLYLRMGRYNLFINPKIYLWLIKEKPKSVILAAGWNDFDVLIICLLKRFAIIDSKLSFWSEANYLTLGSRKDNLFKKIYRKFIYNTCDGYQLISGEMTRLTFKKWDVNNYREIFFPNTIEETTHNIFNTHKVNLSDSINLFISARLDEKIKGVINFLNSLNDVNLRSIRILIAGDGPDRSRLEQLINNHIRYCNVSLLGYCDESKMAELYRNCDIFCLPSFSDPSPLSIIEALAWAKPVLISNHCGNHFECVIEGENGFVYSPNDPSELNTKLNHLINIKSNLSNMGGVSRRVFENTFLKTKVLNNFVNNFK
jgi:glycosyltransferase involved in cell wall biosynthesis